MMIGRLLPLTMFALATACGPPPKDGPIVVSVIGNPPALVDPSQKPLSPPSAALLAATAQGLVRFDSAGQIEPGLAIRWDVSDDGFYYTFRLDSESPLSAEDAARRLRAAIGPTSRNPFKPLLDAVDEIIAVTPEVVEIRLKAPRPNLLELLAQPELALVGKNGGSGPLVIASDAPGPLVLRLASDPEREEGGRNELLLRGEHAALAVTRFAIGQATLVMGGSFADLPLAHAAALPEGALRLDPVTGLFGFVIVNPQGFLKDAGNRRALSIALNRARMVSLIGAPGLAASDSILRRPTTRPTSPAVAAAILSSGILRAGKRPRLRVAMPEGPGADLLFRLVSADWAAIGVDAIRVGADARADLRLIDQVAPSGDESWPLRHLGCDIMALCSKEADAALADARAMPAGPERQSRLATAAAYLESLTSFLPIAQPVRWSLLAPRIEGWQENGRAIHPLHHIRRSASWRRNDRAADAVE